jgi:hypothetical protein
MLLPVVAGGVDVGLDDAAMLLEPEPHIPVNPDVSCVAEDMASPDVGEIAVDVDIPGDAAAEAAAVPVAIAIPPPS